MLKFLQCKSYSHFFSKNVRILCIESAKTVNEMTLNELVKLTTLWTTGPWYLLERHRWYQYLSSKYLLFFFFLFFLFFFKSILDEKYLTWHVLLFCISMYISSIFQRYLIENTFLQISAFYLFIFLFFFILFLFFFFFFLWGWGLYFF